MTQTSILGHRYNLHGLALELTCTVPALQTLISRLLGDFREEEWPDGFNPVAGCIEPYDEQTVVRYLSPNAVPLGNSEGTMEIYQEHERFWIVDDRWGLAELNMLKGEWRSWLLPCPTIDPELCMEAALLWPLAQLMRGRGLYLMPGVSLARDDWGLLILSPFSIEPELRALLSAGFKLIGQRWTALREEDDRIALLHLPGQIERLVTRRRGPDAGSKPIGRWVDLEDEYFGVRRHHAFCQSVLIVEPGRRPQAYVRQTALGSSLVRLRHAWPIYELHPQRRSGQLAMKLSRRCQCWEVQLSNDPKDLLSVLQTLPRQALGQKKVSVSVMAPPVKTPAGSSAPRPGASV